MKQKMVVNIEIDCIYLVVFLVMVFVFPQTLVYATDFSEIYKSKEKSVVTIRTNLGLGTGFYITENFIVTNLHVVNGSSVIAFCESYQGGYSKIINIVIYDKQNDLAILYTDKQNNPLELLKSESLTPGAEIATIGSPLGYEKTITAGNFNQIRGNMKMQISIPISPGASGSPVFNTQGKVIGIVVASRVDGQNLNFAIPSEFVIDLLAKAQLIPKEDYLKVQSQRPQKSNKMDIPNVPPSQVESTSVTVDYQHIDNGLPACGNFSSSFYESPKDGPVKKCICNENVIYTNLFCQCHQCRNKTQVETN